MWPWGACWHGPIKEAIAAAVGCRFPAEVGKLLEELEGLEGFRDFRGLRAGKRQAWTPIRSLRSHCCGLGCLLAWTYKRSHCCGRGVPFPCGGGQTFGGVGRFGGFEASQTAAYKRSHCCGRGVLLSYCGGLVVACLDCGRDKGSRKTGSIPPVVPGATPALAKARLGGYPISNYLYI